MFDLEKLPQRVKGGGLIQQQQVGRPLPGLEHAVPVYPLLHCMPKLVLRTSVTFSHPACVDVHSPGLLLTKFLVLVVVVVVELANF